MPLPSRRLGVILLLAATACGRGNAGEPESSPATARAVRDGPPVPLAAASGVEYPPDLYEQGVEGTVVLRLFVDEQGAVVADSSRIEESSGYPGLDSAALAAVPRLRYAPALRNGRPAAAPFRQPIHFRHPGGGIVAPPADSTEPPEDP